MSDKTNGNNGQHNSYTFHENGGHEHSWYDSKTGVMGYHGEDASKADKETTGHSVNETMTRGDWTRGVKN